MTTTSGDQDPSAPASGTPPLAGLSREEARAAISQATSTLLAQGTRLEKALAGASERRINNVWEYTQSIIAVVIVFTTCVGVTSLSIYHLDTRMPPEWWTIVGLVIGFYFGRSRPLPPMRTGRERDRVTDRPPAVPVNHETEPPHHEEE